MRDDAPEVIAPEIMLLPPVFLMPPALLMPVLFSEIDSARLILLLSISAAFAAIVVPLPAPVVPSALA